MTCKGIDVEDVYQNEKELKKEDVQAMMEWAKKQPHLPEITELQMILFLHSCFFKQEAAKKALDTFYTIRTMCPEHFQSRTLKDPLVKMTADFNLLTLLPKRTPNGEMVIFALLDSNAETFSFNGQIKLLDAVLSIFQHQNGPSTGLNIVVDMKNLSLGHLLRISANVMGLKKFFYLLQEGQPVRMKQIHFINNVSLVDKIVALIKPFLKKELLDCIIIHPGTDTVFKYIPQDIFPEEYGGRCESIQLLRENAKRRLTEYEDFLNAQDNQLVDETKRSGIPKHMSEVFGLEGSFKKLEVD